jgi:dienelactone hydrolase
MRTLRWFFLLLIVAALSLYVFLPAGFGIAALLPAASEVGPPPNGFEAIALQTEDGIPLTVWYAPPARAGGAAIILLHGASGSRQDVRPYAEMLARNGYGVLALDARGHGQSGGRTNRLGWQGTRDVRAAVNYLGQQGIERIGGLGLSMGGEMMLGAASEAPKLSAIVADGATRRSTEELIALPSEQPLVRNFTARVMYAVVRLLGGEPPPKPLLASMIEAGDASFLLIAAGEDEQEVAFNRLFAKTLGSRAELWIATGVEHTGAYAGYPDDYEARVVGFFDRELPAAGAD